MPGDDARTINNSKDKSGADENREQKGVTYLVNVRALPDARSRRGVNVGR
jgi:hypothetical protein